MLKLYSPLQALKDSYLFQTIQKKADEFEARYPHRKLIHLGIGDTSTPLPQCITSPLADYVLQLGSKEGYAGYGPSEGIPSLRESIATQIYHNLCSPDEVFLSDGAKCDLARLLFFFGPDACIGLQSPSYPAFIDDTVLSGASGAYEESLQRYTNLRFFPCSPENNFFPNYGENPEIDLLYVCNPNNPTGSCHTRQELTELVQHAKENQYIIIYDVAYRDFLHLPDYPKSIYEIEGAEQVAIEVGSFSKGFGFTGIRLGWVVIPKALRYHCGTSIHEKWSRYINTCFNGPSRLSQMAGVFALKPEGLAWSAQTIREKVHNAQQLKQALQSKGLTCFGGEQAPYLWLQTPGVSSWDSFQAFLNQYQILTVPGIGFGNRGDGFLRLSAFPSSEVIQEAIERILRF